jgi:hypothetical protein
LPERLPVTHAFTPRQVFVGEGAAGQATLYVRFFKGTKLLVIFPKVYTHCVGSGMKSGLRRVSNFPSAASSAAVNFEREILNQSSYDAQ